MEQYKKLEPRAGDRRERCPADRKRQGYEHPRQHGAGRQGHSKDRRQSQH